MEVTILGSSSSGNSALLRTPDSLVLVDAGFSGKRLCALLENAGHSIDEIDAIFLTHEHSDHCQALTGFSRYRHIPVYANEGTARAVQAKLRHDAQWRVFQTGTTFAFRDLSVESFALPHDAVDPVGFLFEKGGRDLFEPALRIAWVTDLGYAPANVREKIRLADILILEANYDTVLLQADPRRPWSVKQRITSRHGHLSNEDACQLLASIENHRWQDVFLVHLSRDCNRVESVEETLRLQLKATTAFRTRIVAPDGPPQPPLRISAAR